jgi:anti-sigma factor (TIGR02949 family)
MAIDCTEIDTLVHTYLDGELADSDVNEFEEHSAECRECAARIEDEIAFRDRLRRRLAAPRAPQGLHTRIGVLLDQEDRVSASARRRSRFAWLLPATASVAAAAALILFVTTNNASLPVESVAADAVNAHMRRPPVEVQGQAASVSPWIKKHFDSQVDVPRFASADVSLRGARLSHLRGHNAAQLFYRVDRNNQRHDMQVHIINASDLNLSSKSKRVIGGREVWVGVERGYSVVTFKDANGVGYVFTSDMEDADLFDLVVSSDLLLRVDERLGN